MIEGNAQPFRLVAIETRFETLARRPGGVPRSSAIAAAESNVATVATDCRRALAAKIENLEMSLNDDLPDAVITATEPLLGGLNELHDVGATVGFPSITLIAGELCKLFESAGGRTRNAIVGCFVRSLALCLRQEYRHADRSEVRRLVANLKDLALREISRSQSSDPEHLASCIACQ